MRRRNSFSTIHADKKTARRAANTRTTANTLGVLTTMTIPYPRTTHEVTEAIREEAAAHPERTYREHVAAATEIAAAEYRAEIRKLAALDMLELDEL